MRILGLTAAMGVFLATGTAAWAFPTGAPGNFTGSPASGSMTCTLCHTDGGGGAGSVDLLGRPKRYLPGRVYDLRVRIFDPGQMGAGFEISVETPDGTQAGELILADTADTQFAGADPAYVTHTLEGHEAREPAMQANGWCAFPVRWQAPMTDIGPIVFYLAGNATNEDGTSLGDHVYNAAIEAGFNHCPPDVNGDGTVDGVDIAYLLSAWGTPGPDADMTGDGLIDSADLVSLLAGWGPCAP